jgi:hypothetical protein
MDCRDAALRGPVGAARSVRNFPSRENFLRQCFQPAEQILLARDADDLIP